jgi:predicted phosphodiesterase
VQAIISDIHANLEAFEAVLADIERQGVTDIACLGDFVGYGPNPKECIDLAFGFDIALIGNHELALMEE